MNPLLQPLLWLGLVATLVMSLVWLLQWRSRNAGFVDVAWALMLGSAALGFGWFAKGIVYVLAGTLALLVAPAA